MRIALIAHHTAPIAPPFIGGVESQTWYLARWLARRGHAVTVFGLPGTDIPGVEVRELQVAEATFSAEARRDVSAQPDAFLSAHDAYLGLLTELAGNCPFDVVHINTLHYLPVAMARSLPVEPILSLHCPPTPWLESALSVAGSQNRRLPLRVSAVSHALAEQWSHVVRSSPAIVSNGVDLDAWHPGAGGDACVWVGRIVSEKAPHLAIQAARRAGLAIRLAGPIIDAQYWKADVEPLLGQGATYEGHRSHEELVSLVGSAAVSVQSPVWDEPFGLTAAEAIACGTPVAAFDRGGLREVVGVRSGRLADPAGGAASLADAITAAAVLDRAGVRADAEARLGIETMGLGYEALYREQRLVDAVRSRRGLPVSGAARDAAAAQAA